MTDNEIIKGLKCCGGGFGISCRECPYPRTYDANCGNELMRNALDLINRQKAEIERLQADIGKEFTCFVGNPHKVEHCPYLEQLETAKSEAYKEFAERVYKFLCNGRNWTTFKEQWLVNGECYWLKQCLDKISKELTEEGK